MNCTPQMHAFQIRKPLVDDKMQVRRPKVRIGAVPPSRPHVSVCTALLRSGQVITVYNEEVNALRGSARDSKEKICSAALQQNTGLATNCGDSETVPIEASSMKNSVPGKDSTGAQSPEAGFWKLLC